MKFYESHTLNLQFEDITFFFLTNPIKLMNAKSSFIYIYIYSNTPLLLKNIYSKFFFLSTTITR